MSTRDIIVIGASMGGMEVFKQIVYALPRELEAAVFIVWHISPHAPSLLPQILTRAGTLPAQHGVDGEPIQRGHIYVAPPDYHLMLEATHLRLTHSPKENRFRPAIDPLFRSAAYAFGPRVIGVILSGALDDGTAGLWAIKDRGGIAIVQRPEDAQQSSMPLSALQHVEVDYCVPTEEIAPLLVELTRQPLLTQEEGPMAAGLEIETKIGLQQEGLEAGVLELGTPSIFTCPECHGTLLHIQNGKLVRFRCHTGHAFSPQSLIAALTDATEDTLWNVIRAFDESALLLQHLAQHAEETHQAEWAATLRQQEYKTRERAALVRQATLSQHSFKASEVEEDAEQ
jgi:two-component system chemotaxis response regulator CheB